MCSKIQIQKLIENDELDLSLQALNEIPIKDIIKFPTIKSIDLSCNALEIITPNIGLLTSITKLDLSKNKIQFLPDEIGKLVNLQYLDLRSNKLTSLPETMCNLKKLKWLDLKDNPLNTNLSKAAGDCLNKEQCGKCALNVLDFLNQAMSKKLKKTDKKKRREEEIMRQRVLEEEKQREIKKLEKAELRLKRKAEIEERKTQLLESRSSNENMSSFIQNNSSFSDETNVNSITGKLLSFFRHIIAFFFGFLCLVIVVLILLGFCNRNPHKFSSGTVQWCQKANQNIPTSLIYFRNLLWQYANEAF